MSPMTGAYSTEKEPQAWEELPGAPALRKCSDGLVSS